MFRHIIAKHEGDKYIKHFTCWNQALITSSTVPQTAIIKLMITTESQITVIPSEELTEIKLDELLGESCIVLEELTGPQRKSKGYMVLFLDTLRHAVWIEYKRRCLFWKKVVAGHAWASIAKSENIPVPTISEAMGYDSENTTRIYLASLDASIVDKANCLILKLL